MYRILEQGGISFKVWQQHKHFMHNWKLGFVMVILSSKRQARKIPETSLQWHILAKEKVH